MATFAVGSHYKDEQGRIWKVEKLYEDGFRAIRRFVKTSRSYSKNAYALSPESAARYTDRYEDVAV